MLFGSRQMDLIGPVLIVVAGAVEAVAVNWIIGS